MAPWPYYIMQVPVQSRQRRAVYRNFAREGGIWGMDKEGVGGLKYSPATFLTKPHF